MLNFGDALNKIQTPGPNVGFSIFPNDVVESEIYGTILAEEIKNALAVTKIPHHICIGAVVSVSYKFSGGSGQTRTIYKIIGPRTMETIDVRKLPVAVTDLELQAMPIEDTAS